MEELGLQALHRRVGSIDAHRALHVVTVLIAKNVKLGMIGDAKHDINPKPEDNMLSRLIST